MSWQIGPIVFTFFLASNGNDYYGNDVPMDNDDDDDENVCMTNGDFGVSVILRFVSFRLID